MAKVSVSIPDEIDSEIRQRLDYGDSYSAVVADALREYIDGDGLD